MRRMFLILSLIFLLNITSTPGHSQQDLYIRSDRLGIAHISSASRDTPEERYQHALLLGAGWNRWPLYWNWVETTPGNWNWSAFDRQVLDDLQHGLQINAILLGRPEFYSGENQIKGLYEPIFADGSDTPGEGIKPLNPNNKWAHFVYEAVNRYKPGGALAQSVFLAPGDGIRVWEVWNEPDHLSFWSGNIHEYARLLKTSYIVAKMVDPQAQILFGGLLYGTDDNWLAQVLNVFINDPLHEQFNWFMDIVAVHSYNDPWRSGWLTLYTRQTLVSFGIDKPIWLNETGVPVWDDYPGPVWNPDSTHFANSEQQAWYFIQSATFAWSEGADKIFFHQLYDDCGDQPAGSDFPPHGGELCVDNAVCWGSSHGIYRNNPDMACFTQHPLPGTARPAARAYRLLAEVFGTEPFTNGRREFIDDRFTTLLFDRPASNERITVMWNRTQEEAIFELPAAGDNGQLISLHGQSIITADENGIYSLSLQPAAPDTDLSEDDTGRVAIGGAPFILIEYVTGEVTPDDITLDDVNGTQTQIERTPVPTQLPPRPTTDPQFDTRPPVAYILGLPEISEPAFTVAWRGDDDSGIANYIIWVRIDGGEWQPWLDTTDTSAIYSGSPGRSYEFAVWAVDLADNWSENINLQPQATTRVE
jgi:hypothetical protein